MPCLCLSAIHHDGLCRKLGCSLAVLVDVLFESLVGNVHLAKPCKESGASADSSEAQALVAKLQAHITANYYTCTDEILAGLGKMYVADERFKKNIDKYGEGTAEFAAETIAVYCRKA